MRRRTNRSEPSTRRHRKGLGFEMAAVDMAWDARVAHQDWIDDPDAEPESLADMLASEYGIEPADLEEIELFESFMDAMDAEDWQAVGRRRTIN